MRATCALQADERCMMPERSIHIGKDERVLDATIASAPGCIAQDRCGVEAERNVVRMVSPLPVHPVPDRNESIEACRLGTNDAVEAVLCSKGLEALICRFGSDECWSRCHRYSGRSGCVGSTRPATSERR